MPYTTQTWANNDPSTPINASRLGNIETGIKTASSVQLIPTGVKTGTYTLAPNDFVPVDASAASVALTLPTAPADTTCVGIKLIKGFGSNNVTFTCGGSDVLNITGGSTSGSISLLNQAIILQYQASSALWYVLGDDLPLSQTNVRYAQKYDTRHRPIPWLGRTFYGSVPFSPQGLTDAQEGAKYGNFITDSQSLSHVAGLKSGNPDINVWRYIDATYTDDRDLTGTGSGVGYTLANGGSHNDWFLLHSGSRIHDTGTGHGSLMDVGLHSYQQAVIDNCITRAAEAPFDGIFFDQVCTPYGFLGATATSDLYPTNSAWQAAYYSFLTTVVPTLQRRGIKCFINLGDNGATPGLFESWATLVDGVMMESWMDAGSGLAQQDTAFPLVFSHLQWLDSNKKFCQVVNHNTTEAGNIFGLGVMLMAASFDGYSFYDVSNAAYSNENLYTEYDTAAALGPPIGPYTTVQYRVFMRYFANGVVIVNTTGTSTGSISLGRACTGSGVSHVSSVTVGAYSGYILLYD